MSLVFYSAGVWSSGSGAAATGGSALRVFLRTNPNGRQSQEAPSAWRSDFPTSRLRRPAEPHPGEMSVCTLSYPERFYAAVAFAAQCVPVHGTASLCSQRTHSRARSLTTAFRHSLRRPPESAKSVGDETRLLLYALFQQVSREAERTVRSNSGPFGLERGALGSLQSGSGAFSSQRAVSRM